MIMFRFESIQGGKLRALMLGSVLSNGYVASRLIVALHDVIANSNLHVRCLLVGGLSSGKLFLFKTFLLVLILVKTYYTTLLAQFSVMIVRFR